MKDEPVVIIGSIIGSTVVSTIAIGTLIVLQHGAMRSDTNSRFEALRGDTNSRFEALRSDTDSRFEALRGDMNSQFEAVRGDIREIRVDLGDVRERVARIEVILGDFVRGPGDPGPAAN